MTRLNENAALLLIDFQEGFRAPLWGKSHDPEAEANAARLLARFRALQKPVYHVQHLSRNLSSPLAPGQPGVDFMSAVRPLFGERIFQKQVNSAFIGTNLEEILRKDGVRTLIIGGIAVDHCVSTTTRMAANLGFEVLLAADATMAHDRKGADGTIHPAELVHAITLASLHGEFATVLGTAALLSGGFERA